MTTSAPRPDYYDVVIIGAGVVGTNALQMAVGTGARVTVLDKNIDRLRQLDLVYGNRISTLYSNAHAIEEAVVSAELVIGGVLVDGGSFDWDQSGKFPELTEPYDGFHNMVFSEESTVGAFLLRARREGLRDFGACMSPHSAWLILQGIETLPLRMERHINNTEKIVRFLAEHPFVARVGHPLLESHPSHTLANKLLKHGAKGAGSVFSFDIKGSREQGKKFIETLRIFSHLANVGDVRSLVIHPASTTHFRMSDEALAGAGIGPGTIRLSIGLENADDLIDDLKRALKAAEKAGA